jgi:hypothetical protein
MSPLVARVGARTTASCPRSLYAPITYGINPLASCSDSLPRRRAPDNRVAGVAPVLRRLHADRCAREADRRGRGSGLVCSRLDNHVERGFAEPRFDSADKAGLTRNLEFVSDVERFVPTKVAGRENLLAAPEFVDVFK